MNVSSFSRPGTRSARLKPPAGIEWTTILLIFGCYTAWMICGLLYLRAPVAATIALGLPIAFHSSLQHEVLHGHPTRRIQFNEALIFLPLNFFYPFRRYKTLHLRHHFDHRLTDPYDDPESYYLSRADWRQTSRCFRLVLSWNNTYAGRILFGPAITLMAFIAGELRSRSDSCNKIRKDWALHLTGVIPMLLIVIFVFQMPLSAYFLSLYLGASIVSVRSFCEHQWAGDPAARSIIVESRLLGLLFLNNNLHLVHHSYPKAAWYDLPGLYKARRGDWSALNGGYVFRGYLDIVKRYGLRVKEPVAHPGLRLTEARADDRTASRDDCARAWSRGSPHGAGLEPSAELGRQAEIV